MDIKTELNHLECDIEVMHTREVSKEDWEAINNKVSSLYEEFKRQNATFQNSSENDQIEICAHYEMDFTELYNRVKAELLKYKKFDKQRCLENIRALIKDRPDIKIGQIEKEAGVSAGYMSRLEKAEKGADPSIEFIVTAAEILGTSVDDLIFSRIGEMSSSEKMVLDFINKIKEDTIERSFNWIKERKELFSVIHDWHEEYWGSHPLLSPDEEDIEKYGEPCTMKFYSDFFPDAEIKVNGDVYFATIVGSKNKIYILPCLTENDKCLGTQSFYELYLIDVENKRIPLCSTLQTGEFLKKEIEMLYKLAIEDSSNVHVSERAKSIIAGYLDRK